MDQVHRYIANMKMTAFKLKGKKMQGSNVSEIPNKSLHLSVIASNVIRSQSKIVQKLLHLSGDDLKADNTQMHNACV